jgi:ribosome maturation factor RimP
MIDQELIEAHLEDILSETGCFLVEIRVDKNNRILIHVDRESGVSIDDCVLISRGLESKLDRDVEDFALEVSSPGLDSPFRVIEQYNKNIGKKVRILTNEGNTLEGMLQVADDTGILLDRGKPGIIKLKYPEIRSTRRIINI